MYICIVAADVDAVAVVVQVALAREASHGRPVPLPALVPDVDEHGRVLVAQALAADGQRAGLAQVADADVVLARDAGHDDPAGPLEEVQVGEGGRLAVRALAVADLEDPRIPRLAGVELDHLAAVHVDAAPVDARAPRERRAVGLQDSAS